ncbi:response regulator [Sediminibacterium soli]|uniref:response regulator n=1 Tax=Sediminibacterium soli TaxID=2698829 RepID=UPI00137A22CC|nr:response regulator [Sediminibacterium soli]NCI45253.1 response regulator [Sediminibacterium soli]
MKNIDLAWLVDDDKIYTYVMTRQLQQLDCCGKLETFGNGQQAIDALQSNSGNAGELPSLILLDLNMPVLDGWQFLDQFAELRLSKRVCIYIVSSSIDPLDHDRIQQYNCVANFYVKPVKRDDIQQIIAEVKRLVDQ